MAETVAPIKTLSDKMADFLNRLIKKEKKHSIVSYSRFDYFLREIDKDNKHYKAAAEAVAACDEAILIVEKRIGLIEKLKKTNDALEELECFHDLSPEDFSKAKDLLARYHALSRDRAHLLTQLDSFERSLSYMNTLEEEAADAVSEIHEAEQRQKLFKQDIGYLEGERSELVYERERFETGFVFIRQFAFAMCVVFALAMFGLTFLYVSDGTEIVLPMFTLVILVIVLAALLFAFRRRILYEMQLNVKKQSRAVELINKKTVLYAHYTNFLNYEYKKYRVRNASMLKDNLKDYGHYKHLTGRLDSIRSILSQTEAEIEAFFGERDLFAPGATIATFAGAADLDNKKQLHQQLVAERTIIEKNLAAMDQKHEKLWEILTVLSQGEKEESLVNRIIKSYMEEAAKLMRRSSIVLTRG